MGAGDPGERWAIPFVKALIRAPAAPVILLQRREKPDRYRGRLELPGGRVRMDESLVDAVAREVLEESGLTVRRVFPEGVERSDCFGASARASIPLVVAEAMTPSGLVVGHYFACEAEGEPRATVEGSEHQWLTLDELYRRVTEAPEDFATLDRAALSALDRRRLRDWLDDPR
ncbi:MAG: NUDIX domain-containing protein [Candidatus Eisenbacteria bacterium]